MPQRPNIEEIARQAGVSRGTVSRVLNEHPAVSDETRQVRLFKLDANGADAIRIPVTLGRRSINSVEVLNGLAPGDRVILSDMSRWDGNDHIRLN